MIICRSPSTNYITAVTWYRAHRWYNRTHAVSIVVDRDSNGQFPGTCHVYCGTCEQEASR